VLRAGEGASFARSQMTEQVIVTETGPGLPFLMRQDPGTRPVQYLGKRHNVISNV
jgi:hypothetical protein